ncbi:MAG TPA: hypothetical protein VGP13_01010 [Candidatus Paceibacterota bacterium]|nr:hypothetical protein [Candidatus Paceibacterota bacterium]
MTVKTVEPPEASVVEWHLSICVFGIEKEELPAAIKEGMRALARYNKRAAQVIRWHYGLDGQWPKSVDEIRQLLGNISATGVRRSHDRACEFLSQYYLRKSEQVRDGGVLNLWPDNFFRAKRFIDQLPGDSLRAKYVAAQWMRRALDKEVCLRACGQTMGTLLTKWSSVRRDEMVKKLGTRCVKAIEGMLADVGHTVQWDTSTQKVYWPEKTRLELVHNKK